MNGLQRVWLNLRTSLWFVPALIVLASMVAAVFLVERTGHLDAEFVGRWPRIFGAGADGSREMLAAIATSMITVAGVVFSITIVALSLASTQYSPRVLRNFMRDTPTQLVLGVFVGNFAYCLLVLRTVRGGDADTFIPALAVLAGMVYAFVAISLLIYFIHHVAQGIQAFSIVSRIFDDAVAAMDHMFPETLGASAQEQAVAPIQLPRQWAPVVAQAHGYVTAVASGPLLELAIDTGRVVRLRVAIGDFVHEGAVLAELSGLAEADDGAARRLRQCVTLGRQRTPEQDPAFCIQQLVDVAVKALSPGINDPTTASMCTDQLGALILRLSGRRMPHPCRVADGALRVVAPAPGYRALVMLAFAAIIDHSRGNPQVLGRIVAQLEAAERTLSDTRRRRSLALLAQEVQRALRAPEGTLERRLTRRRAWRVEAALLRQAPPPAARSRMGSIEEDAGLSRPG